MRSPLFQLAWRFLTARKLRAILSALSVVMGVGLLVALLTLNATMQRALDVQLDQTFGTYELMAGYRTADTRLSTEDLAEIRSADGVTAVAGILLPYMGEYHQELRPGVNYYGIPNTALGRQFMRVGSGAFPKPGEVALSEAWAKRDGLNIGDVAKLPMPPNGEVEVRVSGFVTVNPRLSIAIFDADWLQGATGRPGSTFALVDLAKGTDEQLLVSDLQHRFTELDFVLRSNILSEVRKNMDALRPVALGMGIAALIAALFLLVASFRISLAERVRELGLLRAVAALPAQVRRLILMEGLIIGAAGSLVGALAGVGTAVLASGAVARMLAVTPVPTAIPWSLVAVATVAGLVITLLSALGVARTAARTSPLRAMRPDLVTEERSAKQGGWFGIGLGLLGAALVGTAFLLSEEAAQGGLRVLLISSGALAVALGLLLGVQRLLPLLLPVLALPIKGRPETEVAARSILRHRRRSGMTVAAMGLGLILVLAIGTLSSSLVHRWYDQVRAEHPADIQLEVPTIYHRGVDAALLAEVQAITGVTKVAGIGEGTHLILTGYDWSKADPDYIKAMDDFDRSDPDPDVRQRDFLHASPADLPTLVEMGAYTLKDGSLDGWGEGALAADLSMAKQLGLKVGDQLLMNVKQGFPAEVVANPEIRTYTVRAIVERSSWRMPRLVLATPVPEAPTTLRAVYANASPAGLAGARVQAKGLTGSLSYNIAEYSDAETATAELQAGLNQRLALLVAVGLVMGAIAVMSLMNAVVSSVNERRKEFALLRAVGSTPVQVRNLILMEAGLLGLVGGIVGIVGGAVLGTGALVGLDMPLADIELPWSLMGASLVVCLLLSLVAGILPARQFLRISPAEAMRVE